MTATWPLIQKPYIDHALGVTRNTDHTVDSMLQVFGVSYAGFPAVFYLDAEDGHVPIFKLTTI